MAKKNLFKYFKTSQILILELLISSKNPWLNSSTEEAWVFP